MSSLLTFSQLTNFKTNGRHANKQYECRTFPSECNVTHCTALQMKEGNVWWGNRRCLDDKVGTIPQNTEEKRKYLWKIAT